MSMVELLGDIKKHHATLCQQLETRVGKEKSAEKSTLLLSVDWINADGNRSSGTTTWDFEHGTFTEITK